MGTEVQPESPGSVTPILYVEGPVAPAIFWVTGAKRFTSLCTPHTPDGNTDALRELSNAIARQGPLLLGPKSRLRS